MIRRNLSKEEADELLFIQDCLSSDDKESILLGLGLLESNYPSTIFTITNGIKASISIGSLIGISRESKYEFVHQYCLDTIITTITNILRNFRYYYETPEFTSRTAD